MEKKKAPQPPPQLQPGPDNVMRALEADANESAEKRKAEATVLKDQGNQAFKKSDYTRAIELYTQGLERLKDFVVLYTNRAQAYNKLEKFTEAMGDCRTALQLEPDNVKALVHLGKAQHGLKDYEAAVTTYQEILKIDEKYEKMVAGYIAAFNLAESTAKSDMEAERLFSEGDVKATGVHEIGLSGDHPQRIEASIGSIGTISGTQNPVIVGSVVTFNSKLPLEGPGSGTADDLLKLLEVESKFCDWLKEIREDNVLAKESSLRFYCSRSMQAAGLILDHIRDMQGDEQKLQRLARLLLCESCSEELTTKLVRPTMVDCSSNKDVKSLSYYLQHVTPPLEGTDFYMHVTKQELTLLRGILLSDSMKSARLIMLHYYLSEQEEQLSLLEETLGVVDEQHHAHLHIEAKSWFDVGRVSHSFFRMQEQKGKPGLCMYQRSPDEVVDLLKALEGCRLDWLALCNTNLHAWMGDVSHILSSLTGLHLIACRLVDDDMKDLISILPAGHGLKGLALDDNAFSLDAVRALTHHLQGLRELNGLRLCNIGPDPELIRQVVSQDLPHLKETAEGTFQKPKNTPTKS